MVQSAASATKPSPDIRSARRLARRIGIGLLIALTSVNATLTTRIVAVAVGEPPAANHALVRDQIAWLQQRVSEGAATQMQNYFPEGYFFTIALTALSTAQATPTGDPRSHEVAEQVRGYLQQLDGPLGLAPFAGVNKPRNGAFHAGWSLLVAVELARLSGTATDADAARARATDIRTALAQSPTGLLESYPQQTWPCDSVVAAAALRRADALVIVPDSEPVLRRWMQQMNRWRDPGTGLLPHQVAPTGAVISGPRGSSQSIIQTFWPDLNTLDPANDGGWGTYQRLFVDRVAGWVGVREYPRGQAGKGDVDSGPLIAGMSASSSVVTLAAAARHNDRTMASALDHEAELLGFGVTLRGQRRYFAGQLVVADAFVAWARTSAPPASEVTLAARSTSTGTPSNPTWWLIALPTTLLTLSCAGALFWLARCGRCWLSPDQVNGQSR